MRALTLRPRDLCAIVYISPYGLLLNWSTQHLQNPPIGCASWAGLDALTFFSCRTWIVDWHNQPLRWRNVFWHLPSGSTHLDSKYRTHQPWPTRPPIFEINDGSPNSIGVLKIAIAVAHPSFQILQIARGEMFSELPHRRSTQKSICVCNSLTWTGSGTIAGMVHSQARRGRWQPPIFLERDERDTENNVVQITEKGSATGTTTHPSLEGRESPNTSCTEGVWPSTPVEQSRSRRERAKARTAAHAKIELHRRIHAACALPCRICGTSHTLADATPRRNLSGFVWEAASHLSCEPWPASFRRSRQMSCPLPTALLGSPSTTTSNLRASNWSSTPRSRSRTASNGVADLQPSVWHVLCPFRHATTSDWNARKNQKPRNTWPTTPNHINGFTNFCPSNNEDTRSKRLWPTQASPS